jgi:hypothetical protein
MRMPWHGIMGMSQAMDAMRARTYTRTNANGTHDRLMRPMVWLGTVPLASRIWAASTERVRGAADSSCGPRGVVCGGKPAPGHCV